MIRIFAGEWLRDLGIPWDSPEQGLVQTDKLLKVKTIIASHKSASTASTKTNCRNSKTGCIIVRPT